MFDFTPEYDPPYADGSIFKLYDYFDENPELGELPEMALQLQVGRNQWGSRGDGSEWAHSFSLSLGTC